MSTSRQLATPGRHARHVVFNCGGGFAFFSFKRGRQEKRVGEKYNGKYLAWVANLANLAANTGYHFAHPVVVPSSFATSRIRTGFLAAKLRHYSRH
jgi:hypothetical protein